MRKFKGRHVSSKSHSFELEQHQWVKNYSLAFSEEDAWFCNSCQFSKIWQDELRKRQTRWVNSFETNFLIASSSSLLTPRFNINFLIFKLCSHVKCSCITSPSPIPSHIFSLILMISNRRLGSERGWEEAGTAMWRVRLCQEVLIIKITVRLAPKGFDEPRTAV